MITAYRPVLDPLGGLERQIQAATDLNFDCRADVLCRHTNGQPSVWFMAGGRFSGDLSVGTPIPSTITLVRAPR